MTGYIFFVSIIIYVLLSIKIVKEDEMGVRVTVGKPQTEKVIKRVIEKNKEGKKIEKRIEVDAAKVLPSGWYFSWFIFQKILRFPTSLQLIQFAVPTVMTKRGRVAGYKDIIESAEVNVLFTLSFYFDAANLLKTIKKAPGISEKKMATVLVPFCDDILRVLIGRVPWRLINEERYKFGQLALGRMYPINPPEKFYVKMPEGHDNDEEKQKIPNGKKGKGEKQDVPLYYFKLATKKEYIPKRDLEKSPFVEFGLKDVVISVQNIDFADEELKKAVSAAEKASLTAAATRLVADGERYKKVEEGKGEAEARQAMVKVIKEEKDLEVLLTLREVAKGTSNTILYQLPRVFESKVAELLGGSSPGEIAKLFSEENKKYFVNVLQEAIEKLKQTSGGNK